MILTKANNCDSITIQSNLFAESTQSTSAGLVLTTQINCCSDKKNTTINIGRTSNYVVLPDLFDSSWTKLKDGIYSFTLTLTLTNGTTKIEKGCILVDCALLCKLVTFMAHNPESKAYEKYELIKLGENCGMCDCSDMCLLYKSLIKDVNLTKEEKGCDCK